MSSSISSIGSSPASTAPATTATSPVSTSAIPASVTADLSFEAGVVATFSSPTAAADPTTELYTNLAGLSTTSTSSIDLNTQWANALAGNASLAPLAVQMTADQALLSAVL
ncbi:MAG: hypothetical protein JSR59_09365 [Proteobacteria bacterium]|nr:hypothetical protein [Pseudomonadota bacterium]